MSFIININLIIFFTMKCYIITVWNIYFIANYTTIHRDCKKTIRQYSIDF